jgi:uncharacterized repeat protein (TIGR01451 family)
MKKYLITAALILAVITTLTAGTLANYQLALADFTGNVKTKTFCVSPTAGGAFTDNNLKIAPGDTVYYKMTVTNGGEATADIFANAALSTTLGNHLVLSFVDSTDPATANTLGWSGCSFMGVITAQHRDFYVKVAWPYDSSVNEIANMGTPVSFTLHMNAVSTNEGNKFGDA